MNLPARTLVLKSLMMKEKLVLALDTGFDADSLEGLRLVKASRGSGWFHQGEILTPWTTRGVLQQDKKLLVWGDLNLVPEGSTPEFWPRAGEEGRDFLKAFVLAWTARAALSDPLPAFSSSSVVPYLTPKGWAFAFLPPELQTVLDSLQPLADRLAWDHLRLPESQGAPSWAFTSAALAWDLVAGTLPWAQDDESHLRQEIRTLKQTLTQDELPEGPDPETQRLWLDSVTGRIGPLAVQLWKGWATGHPSWNLPFPDPARARRRAAALARRNLRRGRAAFWRRNGTLLTAWSAGTVLVLALLGTVVWGLVKPDPTDEWTPGQVVQGYYSALDSLDAVLLRKLTLNDRRGQPDLIQDQEETTNFFVLRQVRTAYEHQSPVVDAQDWENQGKPALESGQILYGTAGFELSGKDTSWIVRYRKWISVSEEGLIPVPQGMKVVDRIDLTKTTRGWKISNLHRLRQPLP